MLSILPLENIVYSGKNQRICGWLTCKVELENPKVTFFALFYPNTSLDMEQDVSR